ncbi:hypothetical protein QOZ62_28925, partial [Pseudomonas aeruginosa]|uniref:hypothetical protein n=1 Tax=Pseudomonas aeruginosa TaxID=287 RepID=UPI003458587A
PFAGCWRPCAGWRSAPPSAAKAAWSDYAIPANSHVSPVLSFWHDPAVDSFKTGVADAKKILQDAGYRVVGGKLYYPVGKQEKLATE